MASPASSLPNTRVPQRANRNAIQLALIGILFGFAIGLLTAIGQYALPDSIEQIADSSAMWVIIAFVMGRYAPSLVMAILAGTRFHLLEVCRGPSGSPTSSVPLR